MNWRFWESRAKPRLWNHGWDLEMSARPEWCAATNVFEVFQGGTAKEQYWERRLRVLSGTRVHLDQQAGRPIVEVAPLLETIRAGRVVYLPPDGGEVYRPGAVYRVTVTASQLGAEDLALDVQDVQAQLNGGASRLALCRRALREWADNPDDLHTEALRVAYFGISRQGRRYLMGMDAKDHAVRMFFEAEGERRALMKEALLNTCRLYASEIAE